MTLEQAATHLISNAITWLEANKGRDRAWLTTNLPSVFLQSAEMLNSTKEFPSSYRNRDFLRGSNLVIKLKSDGSLAEISFFVPSWGRLMEFEIVNIRRLNTLMADAVVSIEREGLSSHYKGILIDRIDRADKRGDVPLLVIHDTRKIDSFNFKTS